MQQLGGEGWDIPNGIVTDNKNNVYIAGGFTQNLQGAKKNIKSQGNRDVYVARFTEKGKLQWLWQAGGEYMDKITAIKSAPDNDLYITGILQGEMKFGKQKISGESKKLFVARINKRGKADWVQTIPYFDVASGYLLETDPQGNILLGGVFADSLFCPTGNLVSQGHNDIFIARLKPDGTLDQTKQYGSKAKEQLTALSCDSLGHIYLAGNVEKTLEADHVEIKAQYNTQKSNSFILQLDSTLTTQWSKPFASPSYAEITGLACDKQNNLLLSGNYSHELLVDTLTYTSNGLTDFFVCKANTIGHIQWIKTFGATYGDCVNDLKINKLDGAMITGSFNDTLYLDSLQITSLTSHADAFIAQLSPQGNITWAEAIHGEGGNFSRGATLDTKGNLYLMGSFKGKMTAGTTEIESLGDEDIFVAKYYNCSPTPNAIEHPDFICEGTEGILSVDKAYMNTVWNDTLPDVHHMTITAPGLYYVSMVDKRGCVITDSVQIRQIPTYEFTLGQDTAMLVDSELELNGPDYAFAYQWPDGSNTQNFLVNNQNQVPGHYKYELIITDSTNCQWSSTIQVEYYTKPEHADLSQGEKLISIYPNPVKESLHWHLETNKEAQMTIEIVNETGRIYHHQKIDRYQPGNQMTVDVSSLTSGIYYFSIISKDSRITKKFVKN